MKSEEQMLAMKIGKAISKRRQACKLTQDYVAEQLGIGTEAVSRMERGTVMPTVARLIELAKIFSCPVSDLLMESSNRPADQGTVIAGQIEDLPEKDRIFILEMLEKLTLHLKN